MRAKPITHEEAELLFHMGALLYVRMGDFYNTDYDCGSRCWVSWASKNVEIGNFCYYPVELGSDDNMGGKPCEGGPHFPKEFKQFY